MLYNWKFKDLTQPESRLIACRVQTLDKDNFHVT